jgi:tetratricopeptide (TPR) repeat protein
MSFDKSKAMRNAERYVSQGKIGAAISEYRAVVDNDPRDIATLNMLGDLYAKNADKRKAIDCYMQVADHYNKQGFAQKAIAIYNKVSRIQPESIEVSAKLAELHKGKGSLSEARAHYTTLAEHYQRNGRRIEALAMYKQIALLDPNNTEVCLSLADQYLRENQKDDALEAYAEAGGRFSRQNRHEEAIRALMKGYDLRPTDLRILGGLVKAQTALGRAYKAAALLEEILSEDPYNRDVLYLLIECCIDSQNAAGAEKAVTKLVEIEPANYPKFLELIRIYLNVNDPESAARILTMSSEYLLAAGQSDECAKWINEILERDPSQLSGLRLLVRYNSWLKDENGFRLALERLYAAASKNGSVEDERFALAQLVVIRPHEMRYRDRLNEINDEFGFDDEPIDAELLKAQFADDAVAAEPAEGRSLNGHKPSPGEVDIERFDAADDVISAEIIDAPEVATARNLTRADEEKIQKELDSIGFYIENDYNELAEKALKELAADYGDREEFAALRRRIGAVVDDETPPKAVVEEVVDDVTEIADEIAASTLGIDQIRSEFGIDGDTTADDYETHYQMAVAYQEMGLAEQAIAEFQDAIALVDISDGTRRFYQCANLLGHCFMQNAMPNHAITWFARALDSPDISDEEYHGLWYELAAAHESNGEMDEASLLFEKIYAENVDFRDVAEKVKNVVSK